MAFHLGIESHGHGGIFLGGLDCHLLSLLELFRETPGAEMIASNLQMK